MPMFEFHCSSCDNEFEELVLSSAAESSIKCPNCGSPAVEKKMSCFSGKSGSSPAGGGSAPSNCGFT